MYPTYIWYWENRIPTEKKPTNSKIHMWKDMTDLTEFMSTDSGINLMRAWDKKGTLMMGLKQTYERSGMEDAGHLEPNLENRFTQNMVFHGLIDELQFWSVRKDIMNPNKPPFNGVFSISPKTGWGMTTEFEFTTDEWEDD